MTISSAQSRAARGLLGREQAALAAEAGVKLTTLVEIESGVNDPRTMAVLQGVLEAAGILFLERDGVQRAEPTSQVELSRLLESPPTSAPHASTLPELMTLKEVASFAKVHRSTIYDWIAEGKFPKAVKITDKVVRWRRDEVVAWFKMLAGRN